MNTSTVMACLDYTPLLSVDSHILSGTRIFIWANPNNGDQMPYELYDTGWIKPIYGIMCLTWFLLSHGLLPHVTSVTCYNNISIPFTIMINNLCEFLGNIIISIGSKLIQLESFIFNQFNYINPIYNGLKLIESMFNNININTGTPSYHYVPSNIRRRKTSTGRRLCLYFARKRRLRRQRTTRKNDNRDIAESKHATPSFNPMESLCL
jgi:hypothetical protein